MSLLSAIKKRWNNYLEKLAKANKESFGGDVPDCCKMGRSTNEAKRT